MNLAQRPGNSYGVQKAIAELLIDDYTRRGFLDGRALRLPVVLLRGNNDTPTLSEHISAVVREPLLGRPAVSPFYPDTPMPVVSVGAVARAFCTLFELPTEALGAVRTINLPALTVTLDEMVDAVERRVGSQARGLIDWRPDPKIAELLAQMPQAHHLDPRDRRRHRGRGELRFGAGRFPGERGPMTERGSRLDFTVPVHACDSHVHVFPGTGRYPYVAKRVYTPPDAPVVALESYLSALGLARVVIVQPSIYGADNAALLDTVCRARAPAGPGRRGDR